MKAIEINSKTDHKGILKLDYPLNKLDTKVRVLILVDESHEEEEEDLWFSTISSNPSFDFLKDEAEDIYTINDGEPFND